MAKQPQPKDAVSNVAISNGVEVDSKTSKKRKLKHADAVPDAAAGYGALSKEERKRLKALRKELKHKDAVSETEFPPREASNGTATHDDGNTAKKGARKAERKRLKELTRASRKANRTSDGYDEPSIDTEDVTPAIEDLSVGKTMNDTAIKDSEQGKDVGASESMPDGIDEVHREPSGKDKRKKKKKKNETRARHPQASPNGVSSEDIQNLEIAASPSGAYVEDDSLAALAQSDIDAFLREHYISIDDPLSKNTFRPIISFDHLPRQSPTKIRAFASFKKPTPIQSAAWPFLLSGRDVIGIAETGSGKTLAFGLPCVRYISSFSAPDLKAAPTRAVMISPTRELAMQIHAQMAALAEPYGLSCACIYGGASKDNQRNELESAHIIVATPGRLNDFLSEGSADLSSASYLVLDEADRMLDTGFAKEIETIISACPTSSNGRQTLMFTATWPASVRELASKYLSSPARISIGQDNPTADLRANTRITQRVEVIEPFDKQFRLMSILRELQQPPHSKSDRVLIFALYKKEADRVASFLSHKGFNVAGIHGDLSQDRRTRALADFKAGKVPLLVATDVAARGLDVPNVRAVVNYTFPLTVEEYVHRIGRTGRAGSEGLAITFFTFHDKPHSGALINVLKAAGQIVPDDLMKFGTTVKKKGHEAYGAFFKEDTGKKAVKIKFED